MLAVATVGEGAFLGQVPVTLLVIMGLAAVAVQLTTGGIIAFVRRAQTG